MKKLYLLFLMFCLPLCAANLEQTRLGIDRILKQYENKIHVGVEAVSLKKGLKLYEKNAYQNFVPSSNIKLFVAGAALSILGPEFCFETKLLIDKAGNLYLQGSGDPAFADCHLEKMVRELRLQEVLEIKGDLIVDNFAFDEISQGPGWMWDDVNGFTFAQMNALTINHSCLNVSIKPSEILGAAPKVYVHSNSPIITIKNQAVTNEKTHRLSVTRDVTKKENTFYVRGEIAQKGGTKSYRVQVESPHLYAASLLEVMLKKEGIAFSGKIKVQKVPEASKVLAVHRSKPLGKLLINMMKNSDNLYANNFLKKMGQVKYKTQGTWQNGTRAVCKFLEEEAGMDISDLALLDGGGHSRYNLASPHKFVEYLTWIYKKFPYASEFVASLSLAGRDGLLRNRFKETKPFLRAKTGTMTGLSAISGYLMTKDKDLVAFSIITNGFVGKAETYKAEIEDKICQLLLALSMED